jgi:hypothetical protein
MRATLHLTLRDRDGRLVAVRDERNSVMRTGARLVADLFQGQGVAINRMGVGTDDTPESSDFTTEQLTVTGLTGPTDVEIPATAFRTEIDQPHRLVKVRVHATLPESSAVGTVREAGLLAVSQDETVLYNRVTFAPVTKADHELTLFWEVAFPYGDLQWLP